MALYEALAIRDIRDAADLLRPVYDSDAGATAMSAWRCRPISRTTPTRRSRRRAGSGGGRPRQPDDQSAGHGRGLAGDPPTDQRGHQRQHHAALRAGRYEAGRARPIIAGLRDAASSTAAIRAGGQRRQLLRQPHRHAVDGASRPTRDGHRAGLRTSLTVSAGQSGDRQRQARLSALPELCSPDRVAGAGRARARRPNGCCGPAPAPRIRAYRDVLLCRGADRPTTPSTRCRPRRSTPFAITAGCAPASRRTSTRRGDVMATLERAGHLAQRGHRQAAGRRRARCSATPSTSCSARSARSDEPSCRSITRRAVLHPAARDLDTAGHGSRGGVADGAERSGGFGRATPRSGPARTRAQWLGWLGITDDQSAHIGRLKAARPGGRASRACRTRCCSAWAARAWAPR